jgi:hypothetical protein
MPQVRGGELTIVTQPGGATTVQVPAGTPLGSPQQVYRAYRSQRDVLGEQLRNAQNQRSNLLRELGQPNQTDATRAGIEKRIVLQDERIASLDKQIIATEAQIAQAAGIPGATYQPPPPPQTGIDDEIIGVWGVIFLFVAVLPASIAFARRIWRRSAKAEVTLPPQMAQRMESIEQGVEAIALEVERIGESQRFLTQAMAERVEVRALGDGHGERKAERAEVRR